MNGRTLNEYADDHEFTEAEAAAILRVTPRLLADRRRDKQIGCNRYGRYEIRFTAKHLRDYRATKEVKALCLEDRQPRKKVPASVKSATGGCKSSTTPPIGIASGMTPKSAGRSGPQRGAEIFAMLNTAL
jgi:hypothetical protein